MTEAKLSRPARASIVFSGGLALWIAMIVLACLLVGCAGKTTPVQTVTQQVKVEVPAACPAKDEYARLKALRPVPLAQQPKPATMAEQIAKSLAQLGLYEAPGAYADQVNAALDRCQNP